MSDCILSTTADGNECGVVRQIIGVRVFVPAIRCTKCPAADDNTGHVSRVVTSVLRSIASGAICRSCNGIALSATDATNMLAQRPQPPAAIPLTTDGRLDLRACEPCKAALLDAMKSACAPQRNA